MNIFQKYLNASTKDELDLAYDDLLEVVVDDLRLDLLEVKNAEAALDMWLTAAGMPSYAQRVSAIKFDLA